MCKTQLLILLLVNANVNTLLLMFRNLHWLTVSKRILFKCNMELDLISNSMIFLIPMNLVTYSEQEHLDYLEFHTPNRSLMGTGYFPRLHYPLELYTCSNH